MSFIDRFFGKKTPNSAELAAVLAKLESDAASYDDQIKRSDGELKRRAAELDPADYVAKKRERDELAALLQQTIDTIPTAAEAMAAAEQREKYDELTARRKELVRRVKGEVPTLLDGYREHATKAAKHVAAIGEIEDAIQRLNSDLSKAGRGDEVIEHPNSLYRKEPDLHIPEKREKRKKWMRWNQYEGRHEQVSITTWRDGKQVPSDGHGGVFIDAREVEEEVIVQRADTKRGRGLEPLITSVRLPPARIGDEPIWPRPTKS